VLVALGITAGITVGSLSFDEQLKMELSVASQSTFFRVIRFKIQLITLNPSFEVNQKTISGVKFISIPLTSEYS
jgi:hypothetical protein